MRSSLPYRPDVDGLRAIALLLVVAYHAFPAFLHGGFVGVDVFFVISGYLISGILLTDLRGGRFTFRRFYASRVRRILPSMTLVVACTLVAGGAVMWADEYMALGRNAAAAAGSVLNLVLLRDRGYFDSRTAVQPLLHLWSLGVEEQFYLLWPVMLVVTWRRSRSVVRLIVGCLAASLLSSVLLSPTHSRLAFYLPATRIWELLVGALLAAHPDGAPAPRWMQVIRRSGWSPMIGCVMIFLSASMLSERDSFPGWLALFPTAGTAMVIMANPSSWLNHRVLASRVMVFLGLISYPFYLWHWPLLAFARITLGEPLEPRVAFAMIALSFVASWLTYILVDKPLRFGAHSRRRLTGILLTTLATGVAGLGIRVSRGFPMRTAQLAAAEELDRHDNPETAPRCGLPIAALNDCAIRDSASAPTAVIVGDSHARRLFLGLAPALAARGQNLLVLSCNGCIPFYDVQRSDQPYENTTARVARSLDFVATSPTIQTVFLVSRGPWYVLGLGYGSEDAWPLFHLLNPRDTSAATGSVVFANGMRETLRRLTVAGKRVVFVRSIPELGFNPRQCLSIGPRRRRADCEVRMDEYRARNQEYLRTVTYVLPEFPLASQFDPIPYLCDARRCPVMRDDHLVYCDHTHLSLWGSRFLAAEVANEVYPLSSRKASNSGAAFPDRPN